MHGKIYAVLRRYQAKGYVWVKRAGLEHHFCKTAPEAEAFTKALSRPHFILATRNDNPVVGLSRPLPDASREG